MLQPRMDTLLSDDVGACLAPPHPPDICAFARRAPARSAGLATPTAGAARHAVSAVAAHESGPVALGCPLARLDRVANANPRWGAPRIHGELLRLGIDVCQATVAKYMVRGHRPPSQTWRTFLRNHIGQIVAADVFVVPTATYRLLFVLVLLAHDRRRISHVAVTAHPTAAWTAQRLRQASNTGAPRRPIGAPPSEARF